MSDTRPLLLALDTATKCSTVALTRGTLIDGEVLACLSLSSSITHSRRIISSVERLFIDTETTWPDIDAVAVGMGPGSFTGVRIGMATAKGFAAAAEKKLVGISTLDALAAMCVTDKPIVVAMDARKKQVYTATYHYDNGPGNLTRIGEIKVVSPECVAKEIHEEVVIIGDGVITYGELWQKSLGDLAQFAPMHLHAPSASAVGLLCGARLKDGNCLGIGAAAPLYVRASDAELSLADKKKEKQRSGGKN
jgi:tRNA threonylcarbamoyladenosine biosynthesis protein TsaB